MGSKKDDLEYGKPGAWNRRTVGFGASAGSLASATGFIKWRKAGRAVEFYIQVTCQNPGTGTGLMYFDVPAFLRPRDYTTITGRENAINGSMCFAVCGANSTRWYIGYYNNTSTIQTNSFVVLTGTYEAWDGEHA